MRTPHPDPPRAPEASREAREVGLPAAGRGSPSYGPEGNNASPLEGRGREERAGEGWVRATPGEGATPREGWFQAAQRFVGRRAWLFSILAIALLVGQLPSLLAMCCAPPGATGLGTVWFVNDFAQYESAMRQGAEQAGWLIHDPFTAEAHQPTLMFPLYVGIGKLAATLHVPAASLEQTVAVLARALLVLSLWRFCRAFARGRVAARWAFGLALFGS